MLRWLLLPKTTRWNCSPRVGMDECSTLYLLYKNPPVQMQQSTASTNTSTSVVTFSLNVPSKAMKYRCRRGCRSPAGGRAGSRHTGEFPGGHHRQGNHRTTLQSIAVTTHTSNERRGKRSHTRPQYIYKVPLSSYKLESNV